MKFSWGYRGLQERSPDRGSIERLIVHGSASVERQFSKPDELGSGAAIDPWEWFIFGKMAVSNPRRVGLHEMASTALSGVLGAGTPAKSMGAGRAKSPCEGLNGDTFFWL